MQYILALVREFHNVITLFARSVESGYRKVKTHLARIDVQGVVHVPYLFNDQQGPRVSGKTTYREMRVYVWVRRPLGLQDGEPFALSKM